MNIYETTTMLEALKVTPPVFTFLMDTFFPNREFMRTEKALIDIVKGGVKASVFVAPRVGGVLETREGFTTKEITTPKLAPKRVLTGEDLKKRQPGDGIYTVKSPEQIAAEMLMKDLIDMRKENVLATEWFCAKVLQGASFDVTEYDEAGNEAGTFNVDFGFTNKVNVQSSKKWTVDGTDPVADIEKWIDEKLTGKTSATPSVVLLDPEAAKAFTQNQKVKDILDYRAKAQIIQEPRYKGAGVTSYGNFTKYNVEVISYSNIVKMGDGPAEQLLPAGTCIILPERPGTIAYGAVMQKENGSWVTYMEEQVPKYVSDDEKEVDTERLTSRPMPFIKDLDSYFVATGVC